MGTYRKADTYREGAPSHPIERGWQASEPPEKCRGGKIPLDDPWDKAHGAARLFAAFLESGDDCWARDYSVPGAPPSEQRRYPQSDSAFLQAHARAACLPVAVVQRGSTLYLVRKGQRLVD